MHALDIYKWLGVSGNSFRRQVQDNEALYHRAKSFWNTLDSNSILIIAIFIVIGLLLAMFYYTAYNEKPHRHYHPKHWGIMLGITSAISFIVTLLVLLIIAPARLHGALLIEIKIALGNAIYSAIIYLLLSVIWCNWLPTNAYRLFKFKK